MHALAAVPASVAGFTPYIPLVVAAIILYFAYKQRISILWLILIVIAGVLIAGSTIGPSITQLLSQISQGYL